MEISHKTKMRQWEITRTANESERQRIAYLKGPLPVNDPALMRPTKVRVLRPTFCVKGKQVQVDSIIVMPWHEALGMKSLGKVEFVE